MKTKFNAILTLLLAFTVQLSFAQQKTVSGTVSDDQGLPLPGVNIVIKGTSNGTQTDFDGNYSIDVAQGKTLVFSYVGFASQEIAVAASNTIDVTLKASASELDQVVVTALGISREKRSLGYATEQVSGEDISKVKTTNFTNSLSGRVSGLNITRNNNFGGSTNVVIRGNTSLTGNNQALFVVDGVPISNRNSNADGQSEAVGNNYDYGNAAADINPEDIASVNVLKGAAASALYGSRAANGVVLITTKKGKKDHGLGVTINSGIQIGSIDKSTFPTFQKKYGAGYAQEFKQQDIDGDGKDDLVAQFGGDASYGPAYDANLNVYQWNSFDLDSPQYMQKTPWTYAKHGRIDFFETPVTLSNNISITNGNDSGGYRFSYGKKDQSGLLPNSDIHRNEFKFSGNFDVSDKLHVSGFANYIKNDVTGRNGTGYNGNIVGNFRQWWQGNVDLNQQREIYNLTGRNVTWNPQSTEPGAAPAFWDNPYWTRYENYETDTRSRFIGKLQLKYDITDWFNVMGRVTTDTYNTLQEERLAVGSVPARFGVVPAGVSRNTQGSGYLRRDISFYETNYDLMLNFATDITDKLDFHGLLGTNIRRNELNSVAASTAGGLLVPGLYSLQNSVSANPKPVERLEKIGVDGLYASASFGYDKMLYLDATIRRDKTSTLPEDNNVFWYPSVSGNFVFGQLLNTQAISFSKLRLNYAEVGNGAPFDRLQDTYTINNDIGTSLPITKNNPNLKPERTKSYEAGLEMKFLKNRIGFDFTYYKSRSVDQIISTPVPTSTGYSYKLLNAGEIDNKGFEVSLNLVPIKTKDFTWNLNANFTKNENEVVSLAEGINTIQLGDFQGGITIQATEGQPKGVLYGTDFVYDKESGRKVVDPKTGYYEVTSKSNNPIGDTNPDWKGGISNALSYKNLTLSFLIDIQEGGNVFSLDQYYGENTGQYPNTAFTNDLGNPVRNTIANGGGYINPGVNPDGSENTTRVDAHADDDNSSPFGYATYPNSQFVYDASYVKLRQASISYDLPSKFLQKTFLTGLQFTLTGENLWIIHKNVPYADPEAGLSSGNLQGYISGAMPTARQYGFNITAKF